MDLDNGEREVMMDLKGRTTGSHTFGELQMR
jgi:hypothetical protein